MTGPDLGAVLPIDASAELPDAAGGKAHGLRAIARSGLRAPPAWAVLPGAANGALADLVAALRASGIVRVAVRSSAPDEDRRGHSFAGIHETALGIPLDRLAVTVAAVAASALAERAAAYRHQHGLPPAPGPCAVVVQEMLDAEWAGVAFGRGSGVLVEAVEGLGETAVDGSATPEAIELVREREDWRIVRSWPRRQPEAIRSGPDGVVRVPLTGPLPALPAGIAIAVAAGVASLERARGMPLDVEWAAKDGAVAFLQARPQTRPLEDGPPPGETWTRTNVSETVPEISSAVSRVGATDALDRLMHEVFRRLGIPIAADVPLAAAIAGRIVFNERTFAHVGDVLGIPRAWTQVIGGGAGSGTNAYVAPDLRKLLRRLDVVLRLAVFAAGAEGRARRHIRALLASSAREVALLREPPDDGELARRIRSGWAVEMDASLIVVMRVAVAFQNAVSLGAAALAAHPAPAALLARLLDPDQVSVSTRQIEDLMELARALRRWEGARAFFAEIGPAHAALGHWRERLPPPLLSGVEAWLEAYGHRGQYESEIAQPRYADDLRLLAAALRPLVLAAEEPDTIEGRRARRRADAEAAWREVAGVHGRLVRLRVRGPARRLGRLMLVREELRSAMMKRHMATRQMLLDAGRRLVARGQLDSADEIFHLAPDELERTLLDPGFDARGAVARERARIAGWRRLEVPPRFTSEEVASFRRRGPPPESADALLRGTAVSPGEVEGPACVLRSPDDAAKMVTGGILVAPTTDPGWTPVFARAAGVVVELGGVMSHAATVAREYGLPCVSNVDGATGRLRDGDLLRVDGTRGTVEVLARDRP
jgi:pyruvate,water dikinase